MLHEGGPGSASAALSVLHIAWAPRAHFHALKQELGGELETLPTKANPQPWNMISMEAIFIYLSYLLIFEAVERKILYSKLLVCVF